MKILLFNDNPVVRKLVALSAQKTKDELNVVWSVDEIEESDYDLLIMDDALYSDKTFQDIKQYIRYKSALLMATRGNEIPQGFDYTIHKPFLPTDLVDMFVQIDKKLESFVPAPEPLPMEETLMEEEEDPFAINLEDELPELSSSVEETFGDDVFGDDFDLDELEETDEEIASLAGILDQEEVEEVQGLLEDAESDLLFDDEQITVAGIDDIDIPSEPEKEKEESFDFGLLEDEEMPATAASNEAEDEEALNFDFGLLEEEKMPATAAGNEAEDQEPLNFDDIMESLKEDFGEEAESEDFDFDDQILETEPAQSPKFEDEVLSEAESMLGDDDMLEDFDFGEEMTPSTTSADKEDDKLFDELAGELDEDDNEFIMALEDEETEDTNIDDFDLDNLASQIQEAVDELAPEDLEAEMEADDFDLDLGEEIEDTFSTDLSDGGMDTMDELDLLDERELKRAIGEETDEEIDIRVGDSNHASLNIEALGEVTGKSVQMASQEEQTVGGDMGAAEGMEALQTLLKALSNEEVAKSLKGLNITININFGNEK